MSLRKKWVFSLVLNSDSEETKRRETGRLFNNLGPGIENTRSPLNFNLDLGTIKILCDLSSLTDLLYLGLKDHIDTQELFHSELSKTNNYFF